MKVIPLDEVYRWLTEFQPSKLSPPAVQLRDQMVEALDCHHDAEAWRLIERFIWISQSRGTNEEIAEANIEAALAYYRMKYYSKAEKYLFDAVNKYMPHDHRLAVSLWMLGHVLWRFPDRQDEAIVRWQDSCDGFKRLSQSFGSNPTGSAWYAQRCQEMNEAIAQTIANQRLPIEIHLQSQDFDPGREIPAVHTCNGLSISPHLAWKDKPEETQSLVFFMEDLDSPPDASTHWLLFDYPGDQNQIPQGGVGLGVPGVNDFGNLIYDGPCPPRGEVHRYEFKLYALDKDLDLRRGSDSAAVGAAMIGSVVGYGRLLGKYQR